MSVESRFGDGEAVGRYAGGRGHRSVSELKREPRFKQLLTLAEDGDECAVADLFKEFDYVFQGGEEGSCHDAD